MTLELDAFHPDSTDRLSAGKRKPLPEPRPHQVEAIENLISGFQTANRGQLIMPCATGKTLICLWVKEKLKAKRTLVLAPSLGLLSQILNDWDSAARQQFDVLCVCSDQTVGRKGEDEAITLVSDLPFPVSSDVAEITNFLGQDKNQVIFATYQSSPLIAEAQKKTDVPHFDLAVADEAHRCAGKVDSVFGTILDAELIKSHRRLFSTATPRIYRTRLKKKAKEEFGVEVTDMNDEKSFGKPFHTLSFSEAINRKLLTDYRVVVVVVDDERIKGWIEKQLLVKTDTGLPTDAKSLAGQIGLLKAIKDYNLQRVISFHGRVKRARKFSKDIGQVAEWLSDDHKPRGSLRADYVSGEMRTISRRKKLKRLENIGSDEIGLLSNARCLSEGVDVPALDGIAFIDPRSSEIDIIQSVGRVIRLSENKTVGTIVVPVFIGQTDDAETALEASEFKPLCSVLEALKSHDNRLSKELDQIRIDLGAKRKRSVGANDLTNIIFDLRTSVNERFAESFRTHLVEKTTELWMFWFGLLQTYVNEHGDCRAPTIYKTNDGYNLGTWVDSQRQNKDKMGAERRQCLESLPGWSWNVLSDKWQKGFSHLKKFLESNGHCLVPHDYKTDDGYELGAWVYVQRANRDKLDPERRQRLESLPGWSWDKMQETVWEKGFARLREFADREGNCLVPKDFENDDGYRLGAWVQEQRRNKVEMDRDRRARLEALPGWSWNAKLDQWEKDFSHMNEFAQKHGHCRVHIKGCKTDDGFNLGAWVATQRKNKDKMEPDRRARLEALPGWSWDPFSDQWEKSFSRLREYADREGNCLAPQSYKTDDGYNLGAWVRTQRANKDKLDPNRRQRLEALPGWLWDTRRNKNSEHDCSATPVRECSQRQPTQH